MATEKRQPDVNEISSILTQAGVKPSPVRILVLRELAESDRPMSGLEIEDRLASVDRSSITRTLAIFTEHHLVHQISDGSGSMKYEMCANPADGEHTDEHVHFHCRKCGRTYCFYDQQVPEPRVPEGYAAEGATYVINGLCPRCNHRSVS